LTAPAGDVLIAAEVPTMKARSLRSPVLTAAALALWAAPGLAQEAAPPAPLPETAAPVPPEEPAMDLPAITPGPAMTLEQVLAAADRRNLTIEAARLEITKAEAQLKQAYGLVLPAAQAKMQLMHRDHEDAFDFGGASMTIMAQDDLKGSLQVGMPLINAQNWYTLGVARQGVEVARLSIEDARRQLLLAAAKAYYGAIGLGALITMREDAVRSAAHHLRIARARLDAEVGLRIDVIRAETDLAVAHQALLEAHKEHDNLRDMLGWLTDADGLPLPVEVAALAPPAGSREELERRAVIERSDLAAKQALVELASKQLDASWMQFLPTLDVGWGLDYQFTKPGDLGSQDRSRWALVFTLSVPIYNHFRYGDLDYKRASLLQAQLQQEQEAHSATRQVREAHRNWLNAVREVEIAERQLALAGEALQLTLASYEAGTGTSLEVTDARSRRIMAEANVIAKRIAVSTALLDLLQAAGADPAKLGK
jgi:outer membrane protein TolC